MMYNKKKDNQFSFSTQFSTINIFRISLYFARPQKILTELTYHATFSVSLLNYML